MSEDLPRCSSCSTPTPSTPTRAPKSAKLEEIIESDDERHVCQLNEESEAPILQGDDSRAPLTVGLSAAWDPEHGWHQFEIGEVEMALSETRRRPQRLSAVEVKRIDEQYPGE